MIEFNQLEQLVSIAKNKTMSKAANELMISQPALSRSMQKLEADMNVQLFDHYKNKIVLNENGEMVVKYAKKLIEERNKMVEEVQQFDNAHRTISIASCTPAPMMDIEPIINELYQSSKVITRVIELDELIPSLKAKEYSMIITPFEVEDKDLACYAYLDEDLCLSVPLNHRFKDYESISFSEIDGETMLLYSDIGFWYEQHMKDMPNSRFLIQNERTTFNEIVNASTLPSFTSNLSIKREGKAANRIIIPITDDNAHVSFYLVMDKKDRAKYKDLINKIKDYYDY